MPLSDDKIRRLPMTAQTEIASLRSKLQETERRLLELSQPEENDDTDTVIHSYGIRPDVKLPKSCMIRFFLGATEHIDVRVDQDGWLTLRSAEKSLVIQPAVSNEVRVRTEWHWGTHGG